MTDPWVCVMAAPESSDVAGRIAEHLGRHGFRARVGVPDPGDAAVVAVLGPSLPAGLKELSASTVRLVPVTVGAVPGHLVPPVVAALNWIPWDDTRTDGVLAVITRACGTDVATFQAVQSLEARAMGWAVAGERSEDLIDAPKARRELDRAIASGDQLSALALRYARLSRAAVKRANLRRRGRRALWLALAIVLAVGGVQFFGALVAHRDRANVLLVATAVEDDTAAFGQMPKFAGLVLMSDERGEQPPLDAEARLAMMLSAPGPAQFLSVAPSGMFINATAFGADAGVLLVDGDGRLWRGTVGRTDLEELTRVSHGGLLLAADRTLQRWVTSDGSSITFGDGAGSAKVVSHLTDGIEYLSMQGDGEVALAWGASGGEAYSNAGEVRSLRTMPGVLGVGEVQGRLRAVLQDAQTLVVVDVESGDVLWRVPAPEDVATATITNDGTVVAIAGARLLVSTGQSLGDPGLPVASSVLDLRAVSDTEVLLTTIGEGMRLIDMARGRMVADVCNQGSVPFQVALSHDGAWVSCGNWGMTSLWNLEDLRPSPAGVDVTYPTASEAAGTTARVVGGHLEISRGDQRAVLDPSGVGAGEGTERGSSALGLRGALTAVTLSPDGLSVAYGSDMGEVVVADLTTDLDLLVTANRRVHGWGPVDGLAFAEGSVLAGTGDVSWRIAACVGCRVDRAVLLRSFESRRLPCYPADFDAVLPKRISSALGLTVCWTGEGRR